MPRTTREVPPPLELSCLNALWSLGKGNVRDVQQVVCKNRPLAYTTIMTVLDRLVRKGKLSRAKAGRSYCYSPEASRDALRDAAIRDLLEGFFDGSEGDLMAYLAARGKRAEAGRGNGRRAGASRGFGKRGKNRHRTSLNAKPDSGRVFHRWIRLGVAGAARAESGGGDHVPEHGVRGDGAECAGAGGRGIAGAIVARKSRFEDSRVGRGALGRLRVAAGTGARAARNPDEVSQRNVSVAGDGSAGAEYAGSQQRCDAGARRRWKGGREDPGNGEGAGGRVCFAARNRCAAWWRRSRICARRRAAGDGAAHAACARQLGRDPTAARGGDGGDAGILRLHVADDAVRRRGPAAARSAGAAAGGQDHRGGCQDAARGISAGDGGDGRGVRGSARAGGPCAAGADAHERAEQANRTGSSSSRRRSSRCCSCRASASSARRWRATRR